jgi:hypothetical protein
VDYHAVVEANASTGVSGDTAKTTLNSDIPNGEGNLPSRETYKQIIIKVARENNFENVEGLLRLAHCESRFNPNAHNVNKNGTEDWGLFQWNLFYHPHLTKEIATNPHEATQLTIDKINAGGINIWACQWAYFDTDYNYDNN